MVDLQQLMQRCSFQLKVTLLLTNIRYEFESSLHKPKKKSDRRKEAVKTFEKKLHTNLGFFFKKGHYFVKISTNRDWFMIFLVNIHVFESSLTLKHYQLQI